MDKAQLEERVWRIFDGIPLKIRNMTIRTTNSGKLLVIGKTNTIEFKNVSKKKVFQELNNLKNTFYELSIEFKDLHNLIASNDLTIEFHMTYDDSGKAGIGLCSEINGELDWYI